jgi:hypothetical protein
MHVLRIMNRLVKIPIYKWGLQSDSLLFTKNLTTIISEKS